MAPIANYVPFVRSGSPGRGVGPGAGAGWRPIAVTGKLTEEVTVEQGQAAAPLCFLNVLTHLRGPCDGDLDRVVRVVRLGGFVAAPPDSRSMPS